MKLKFCPRCKSSSIEPYIGGMTGAYICKACGYMGPLILEKDIFLTSKEEPTKKNFIKN